MKWTFSLSKFKGRRLTQFQAEEMVSDYINGQLDPERKAAFEKAVIEFPRLRDLIESYRQGQVYAQKLAMIRPSEELKKSILRPETVIDQALERVNFSKWPKSLRMSLEILSVAAVIATVSVLIPWEQLTSLKFGRSGDIVLAEISRQFDIPQEQGLPALSASPEEDSFPDESENEELSPTTSVQVAATAITTTTLVPLNRPVQAVAAIKPAPVLASTTTQVERRLGSLFRGAIHVINARAASQKITQRLSELGGRKAGEVEMGWEREKDLFYYHFTIPEDKYDQLSSLFSEFGSLRLSKERHERVMPEGIIRLIIVVEDKSRGRQ